MKKIVSTRLLCPLLVLAWACVLAGCGSTSKHTGAAKGTAGGPQHPAIQGIISDSEVPGAGGAVVQRGVVARVGPIVVSKSAFDAMMLMEARAQSGRNPIVPVPPAYSSCVSRLQALSTGFGASAQPKSAGVLKAQCAHLYEAAKRQVMQQLLAAAWAAASAQEYGIELTDEEVRERARKGWPSAAKFHEVLKETGNNIPNMLFGVKNAMLTEKLREYAVRNVPAMTDAVLARYYEAHKAKFGRPEERDVQLVRVTHRGKLAVVRHSLETHASFETIANEAGPQPLYVLLHHGVIAGLRSGTLHEPVLNDAIFKAPPGTISGPVEINKFPGYHARFHRNPHDINNIDGEYLFIVQAVHPAETFSLARVRSQLAKELPRLLDQSAIVSFVKQWRAKLRPKTECRPGYVVRKCSEYKPVPGEEPEDAYTVN